jgi:CBS domain containing-hemolysin-like protein
LTLSAQAGHISERGKELAENVLRTLDMKVRHILVPRVNITHLSLRDPLESIISEMVKSGHSRYPLCEGDLDSVVGILHTRDVFAKGTTPTTLSALRALARPPVMVPDGSPLGDLIGRLQRVQSHVAVVLDEYGTVQGLAFLEDALEEIVGPIADEFDEVVSPFMEVSAGEYDVMGTMPLPDAIDRFGLPATDDPSNTVGGYIMSLLGRLPKKGDEVTVGTCRLRVTGLARGRAVSRVRVSVPGVDGALKRPSARPEPLTEANIPAEPER